MMNILKKRKNYLVKRRFPPKNIFFPMVLILWAFFSSATAQKFKPITGKLPKEVAQALSLAGNNCSELEKVLAHYSSPKDSLQYRAACFLIANMRWHRSSCASIQPDLDFVQLVQTADSLYYDLVKDKTLPQIDTIWETPEFKKIQNLIQNKIKSTTFNEPQITPVDNDSATDLNIIRSGFLIDQIDNAFALRKTSPLVQKLGFQDFCAYTLPYRLLDGNNFRYSSKDFNRFFAKYLGEVNENNIPECVGRYNATVNNFRRILGHYPLENCTGFEELLFDGVKDFDCFNIAQYGNIVLNACGIPVDIEYNVSYQLYQGRHAQCRVADIFGNRRCFSPEGEIPDLKTDPYEDFHRLGLMNLYRICFSQQQNNPNALKAQGEFVPAEGGLNDPSIEDVTDKSILTVSLTLPFHEKTNDRLAYLASFNSATGIIPVVWGRINKTEAEVVFKNVIPNRMYFPVYYTDNYPTSFGRAFYLKLLDSTTRKTKMIYLEDDNTAKTTATLVLTRKFPRKPHMIEVAQNLVGTRVLASDDRKFTTADTLFTLKEPPGPYLQDISIGNNKAYQYYKIEAPQEHPNINISEIMFLTDKKYNYPNIDIPSSLPVFGPQDKKIKDSDLVWVLDTSVKVLKTRSEYDGSMETAPGAYRSIALRLKQPEIITTIRLAPLNANNGVVRGNEYQLYYYDNGRWNTFGESQIAEYEYVEFKDAPKGKLYWLRNLTTGKEELPFTIDEKTGKQLFLYFDFQ